MYRQKTSSIAALAAFCVTTGMLAACSSSTKDTGGNAASTITIGNFSSATAGLIAPEVRGGAQAAIDSINAAGGIKGHHLKLSFCDTKTDPNQEVACARQMVKDKVAAVVDPQMFYSPSSLPILQKAGIAALASQGITQNEFQTAVAFPLAGIPGWFYGAVAQLVKNGATKISVIGVDNASSKFANQTTLDAIKAAGLTPLHSISVDPTSSDYAPAAAQAVAGGTDGIVLTLSPESGPPALKALHAAGYKGHIASLTDVFPQQAVTAVGADAEGMLLTSLLALPDDMSNPSTAPFLADLAKYSSGTKANGFSYEAWAATQLFAKAVSGLDKYDSASVLAALNNVDQIDLPALGGYKIKGQSSPLSNLPRLLHTQVAQAVVKNGKIVDNGGSFDPFAFLADFKNKS